MQFLMSSAERDALLKGEVYNVVTVKPADMQSSTFVRVFSVPLNALMSL